MVLNQLKIVQNSRIFCPKLKISAFFSNLRRFLTKYNKFCLKSGKFVQKLKKLPKTQGKISKNLKFPANPLSSKARKTSKKKSGLAVLATFIQIINLVKAKSCPKLLGYETVHLLSTPAYTALLSLGRQQVQPLEVTAMWPQ